MRGNEWPLYLLSLKSSCPWMSRHWTGPRVWQDLEIKSRWRKILRKYSTWYVQWHKILRCLHENMYVLQYVLTLLDSYFNCCISVLWRKQQKKHYFHSDRTSVQVTTIGSAVSTRVVPRTAGVSLGQSRVAGHRSTCIDCPLRWSMECRQEC